MDGLGGPLTMKSRLLAVGSTRAGSAEPDGWPGVAGVVVAMAGVQVTATAVGDVLQWPVAELVAAQGGRVCRCASNSGAIPTGAHVVWQVAADAAPSSCWVGGF
jgi:hypothetical protein